MEYTPTARYSKCKWTERKGQQKVGIHNAEKPYENKLKEILCPLISIWDVFERKGVLGSGKYNMLSNPCLIFRNLIVRKKRRGLVLRKSARNGYRDGTIRIVETNQYASCKEMKTSIIQLCTERFDVFNQEADWVWVSQLIDSARVDFWGIQQESVAIVHQTDVEY